MTAAVPLIQRLAQTMPRGVHLMARAFGMALPTRVRANVHGCTTMLDLREGIQRTMFLDRYERTETACLQRCVRPGDVVVDAGASFGYYSALGALVVGSAGTVYAFEPSPVAAASIEEMFSGSACGNIILVKAALGSETGTAELQMPNTPNLHAPSIFKTDPAFTALRVDVVSLDDFAEARGIERVRLVKIDVEGCDPNVIAGMSRMLAQRRVDNIICEFNSGWLRANGTTPEELKVTILDAGFRIAGETKLQEGLACHDGGRFSLQNLWFTLER